MLPGSGHGALNERATWMAAILFAGLTILLAYPISIHPIGLRFPTGPDGDLGWYLLGWDTHAFLHRPWAIFDANIYYPERFTLAYGENLIGVAIFAAPVVWATGNLLLAANLSSLLSTTLCGLGAYLLARRVRVSVAGAVICGIVFECAPPKFLRIGQLPLSSLQWIPLALAALHAYFDHGRRRDLRLVALFITLQVLSSGHGAVFLAVILIVFGCYRFALGEPIRLMSRLRDLGVTGVLLLLPAVLVFLPYLTVQREVGLKRGLGSWIANYGSFLASPSHVHKYLLNVFSLESVNENATAFLFPGYVPIALGLVALFWPQHWPSLSVRKAWDAAVATLEAALLGTAVVAALLTLGTLVIVRGGTLRVVAPGTAMAAWFVYGALLIPGVLVRRLLPVDTVKRHARAALAVLLAAAGWMTVTEIRSTARAGDGLRAEYFDNEGWQGPSRLTTVDARFSAETMKYRWDGVPPDQFSARWTGFLTVGRASTYYFRTTSDDGSRLFIDRALVVDNSGIHPPTTRSGSLHLEPGSHLVVLEYSQAGVGSALEWTWSRDGHDYERVPAWALSQRQTHYSTALTAHILDWVVGVVAVGLAGLTAAYVWAVLWGRGPALRLWAEPVRKNATVFYSLLTFIALWLSLGPPYGIWRYVYWLPGFSFIRANTRFTLVALLGLAVLAGIGFDRLARRVTRTQSIALAAVIAIVLVAEFSAMPLASQASNFNVPSIDRWLDTLPKPFVVAEVPVYNQETQLGAFERQEVNYMIHSSAHWQKTVHGYSGWRTVFHSQLYWYMQFFPDDDSLRKLSDAGVTYIVVHSNAYPKEEWARVERRIQEYPSYLRLLRQDDTGRVYLLTRPANVGGAIPSR
jgi:hypothetical protein